RRADRLDGGDGLRGDHRHPGHRVAVGRGGRQPGAVPPAGRAADEVDRPNYNISHKSMTEQIANKWLELRNKQNIVSAAMDNRIYYVVHNPDGEALEQGCMGNEIWVLDVA